MPVALPPYSVGTLGNAPATSAPAHSAGSHWAFSTLGTAGVLAPGAAGLSSRLLSEQPPVLGAAIDLAEALPPLSRPSSTLMQQPPLSSRPATASGRIPTAAERTWGERQPVGRAIGQLPVEDEENFRENLVGTVHIAGKPLAAPTMPPRLAVLMSLLAREVADRKASESVAPKSRRDRWAL